MQEKKHELEKKYISLRDAANMNAVYADLMARGVTVEVHTFSGHPHGYAGWKIIDGKGDPNFDLWEDLADHFMQDIYRKNNVYKN